MLEIRLQSGAVVSFDGRVVETFLPGTASTRCHVASLSQATLRDDAGGRSLVLEPIGIELEVASTEARRARALVEAIEDARRSD